MYPKYGFGFVALLALTLGGCGGGSDPGDAPHSDVPTLEITEFNALTIAAEVYRVVAVDVPYSAALAMDPANVNLVNPDACTTGTLSGGGGMMGGGMAMDMIFNNCLLAGSPSAHTLTVNGMCSNTAGSALVETVMGDVISLTSLASPGATPETVTLHAFSVTRDNEVMTNASGTLHGVADDAGNIVMFSTPTAFTGTTAEPLTGELLVSGANSSLRLSIIAGTTDFTLEVDADGNGDYESFQTWDWNTVFWSQIP